MIDIENNFEETFRYIVEFSGRRVSLAMPASEQLSFRTPQAAFSRILISNDIDLYYGAEQAGVAVPSNKNAVLVFASGAKADYYRGMYDKWKANH